MKHPVLRRASETQAIVLRASKHRLQPPENLPPGPKSAPAKPQGGFTLLEIMLVVVIISLLLGTAIYRMGGVVETGREAAVKADIQALSTQMKLYSGMNGFYPTQSQGLQALVKQPSSAPVPKQWHQAFEKVPHDPWDSEYNYTFPGRHNPNSFDVFSSGPDRQPGTADDIGNWDK